MNRVNNKKDANCVLTNTEVKSWEPTMACSTQTDLNIYTVPCIVNDKYIKKDDKIVLYQEAANVAAKRKQDAVLPVLEARASGKEAKKG